MANELKMKNKVKLQGGAQISTETASRALTLDASGNITSSATTDTELGHLSGVTSNVQTQINDAQADATQALSDAAAAQADATQALADAATAQSAANAAQADATQALADAATAQSAANAAQADATQALADAATAQSTIDNHLADAIDAHDASAISSVPSGNLSATDVQSALDELQTDVDSRIASSEKGASNGVATLDAGGKIPASQLPNSVMELQGEWNANTNSPTLADGAGNAGDVYEVTVAGTQDLGSGSISFAVGDWAVYSASGVWYKSLNSNAVTSVFSRTGTVTAQSGDYTASQITNTPAGNIAATDVQSAINELDTEKASATGIYGHVSQNSSGTPYALAATTHSLLVFGSVAQQVNMPDETGLKTGERFYIRNSSTQSITLKKNDGSTNILVSSPSIVQTIPSGVNAILTYIGAGGFLPHFYISSGLDPANYGTNAASLKIINLATGTLSTDAVNKGQMDTADSAIQTNLDNHINDTVDAHDASAISVSPSGNLSSTDVQSALVELQGDIDAMPGSSTGDIAETSFSIANNQVSAANVTGFAFASGTVRGFKAIASVEIDATAGLYETFELVGINKSGSFEMAQSAVGDESGIVFSITSAGQVQYTSANYSGFVSGAIKFRAWTTTV